MQAGKLRHRITIQAPAPSQNPFQNADGWTDIITVWAQISPATSKEVYQAQQQNMRVSHTVTIRYVGASFQVGSGYRLLYGNRAFDLQQGIINVDERNRELHLYAWEVAPIQGGVENGS